jgi:murein DD-endopeptidase MepM/ murein hydrolase activator NlpD
VKKSNLLSAFCKRTVDMDACPPRIVVSALVALVCVGAVGGLAGFQLGEGSAERHELETVTRKMQAELAAERELIEDAKVEQRAHLDALALRVAELQAHLMRLDALGDRLVVVGKLDKEEFDFSVAPPMGGIDETLPDGNQSSADLVEDMQQISGLLRDRESKLEQLETLLMTRELKAEITPSGKPVKKGWLSSGFGRRTDPFSGKKTYHRGIDFAGKRGSDIVAVASGIVTRSERVSGYGNVVEIRHAEGYSTLYGHNQKNLVAEGDMVSKGQTIALLGSTGRSSGPHVHFEVHRNDKIVNPLRYVR